MRTTCTIAALLIALAARVDAGQSRPQGDPLPPDDAPFVILAGVGKDDPFHGAVDSLLKIHPSARVLHFGDDGPESLEAELRSAAPRFVCVVLKPSALDANFQGRFLGLCARLDEDPFPDFSYGYVTGASAEEAVKFAGNIGRAMKAERPKRLLEVPTMGQGKSGKQDFPTSEGLGVAWPRTVVFFGAADGKPLTEEQAGEHFAANVSEFSNRGAMMMGGHGSPEGIHGNISGTLLRKIGPDLFPAFVYNYACLTGCTGRAFEWVEKPEEWSVFKAKNVDPMKSMALAVLASGASGYVATIEPRPAGPGMSGELFWALTTGEPVGDVRRREYSMLALAFLDWGEKGLVPPVYADGAARKPVKDAVRDMMMPNAAETVLFGDPSMRLVDSGKDPVEATWTRAGDRHSLEIKVRARSYALTFDPYRSWGRDRQMASKFYAAVDIPADVGAIGLVEAIGVFAGKKAVEHDRLAWAVEDDRGRRRLHVKVNVPPAALAMCEPVARFDVLPPGAKASAPPKKTATEPGEGDSDADRALSSPWKLDRREWKLESFLGFVESFLAEHGEKYGSGRIGFELSGDAKQLAGSTVVIELDGQPLRKAVDDICAQLGLEFELDRAANALRFRKAEKERK